MIKRNDQPCWEATCDHCGEGDNTELGGSFHYESEAELLKAVESYQEWTVVRNEDGSVRAVYCFSCWEEFDEQRRGELQA